jgi:hypothetical protein
VLEPARHGTVFSRLIDAIRTYAIRTPVIVVLIVVIDARIEMPPNGLLNEEVLSEPRRFNARSLRSSERVAPVILASSGSLGRDMNAVDAVRPFRPAIRYGRDSSELGSPKLARRPWELLLRSEAGTCDCRVAMAPS